MVKEPLPPNATVLCDWGAMFCEETVNPSGNPCRAVSLWESEQLFMHDELKASEALLPAWIEISGWSHSLTAYKVVHCRSQPSQPTGSTLVVLDNWDKVSTWYCYHNLQPSKHERQQIAFLHTLWTCCYILVRECSLVHDLPAFRVKN